MNRWFERHCVRSGCYGQRRVKSDIRFSVDMKFKENKIHIPFPQRDIHIKAEQVPKDFMPEAMKQEKSEEK